MRRHLHHRASALLAPLLLTGLLVALAPAAGATPANQESIQVADACSFDDCGYAIDFVASGEIRLLFQPVPHTGGSYVKVHEQFRVTTVFSRPDTGTSFSVEERTLDTETRARLLPDGTLQVDRVKAGQSFTIRDATGRVVSRDRGMERQINVFDEDGLLSADLVALHGPHPSAGRDFCEVAGPLLG